MRGVNPVGLAGRLMGAISTFTASRTVAKLAGGCKWAVWGVWAAHGVSGLLFSAPPAGITAGEIGGWKSTDLPSDPESQ